jgi:hypothetical protein
MAFRRDQLSQATIQRLELLSGDPQKLLARISELRSYSRESAKGQRGFETTCPSRHGCAIPAAWSRDRQSSYARELLCVERLSADRSVLYHQFHR